MSVITDALIVTMHGEDEAIAHVNRWLAENDPRKPQLSKLDAEDAGAGGTKVSSMVLYAAAFNYVDLGGLEEAIRAAPWRCPSSVVAYFNDEHMPTFVMSPQRPGRWTTREKHSGPARIA